MLKSRLCDRFLIHINWKMRTGSIYAAGETTRKPLKRSALVQLSQRLTGSGVLRCAVMGNTSAGLHNNNAGCGEQTRTGTVRQIQRRTAVHYLVSPPRQPRKTSDKPKPKYTLLHPAGSGDTRGTDVCFLYEPRAAFYTGKRAKKQNKIAHAFGSVRKNFHQPVAPLCDANQKKLAFGRATDLK